MFEQIFLMILAMIIMMNGFAIIVGGPSAAGKLNMSILNWIRRFIGGLLVSLGMAIAGKKK